MKQQHRFGQFLVSGVFILAVSSGIVLASGPAGTEVSSPASDWLIDVIDATNEVGYNVSVATDPVTGESYISYYEGAVGGDLWFAMTGAPTGNCGPGNTWDCQVVDTEGIVGKFSSIAVGGPGPVASLYISYHDVTTGSLKVAEGTVDRATGEILTGDFYVVDRGDPGSSLLIGTRTSIDLDGSGTPHIGYQVDLGAVQAIKYATRVAPGTGNCGEGAGAGQWQCSNVHLDSGIGDYIDIDVGPGGVPNIAFFTSNEAYTYPMIATNVASGGSCNNSDVWNCAPIRHTNQDTGEYLSFEIAVGAVKHLAYRNSTMESLEWTRYVGPGLGNCGPGDDSYQCEWIDDIGPAGTPSGIALATDGAGYPLIAYQDVGSGDVDLMIARPMDATRWNPNPNCGPNPVMLFEWHCEILDGGDINHAEAVGGLSIAMNANGEATVAYRELFGLPPDEGRLKVAMEPVSIFVDGFESGNTTEWSSTSP